METKTCFKCNQEKQLNDFYKHPEMADGHLNKCKECNKKDVKDNYSINKSTPGFIEKERTRGRKKYHRLYEGTGKSRPNSTKRWMEKFPEKRKATNLSASLSPPLPGLERHHWSYNEEHFKDVIWLTKQHHMKGHRFIIYDQERKMYRTCKDLILLDSKEKHEVFIKDCIEKLPD